MALDDYLTEIARNNGRSPRDRVISDSFYGLNISGRNAAIPLNTENHGYTFFTRPDMNMSYDNLAADRVLSNLLNQDEFSVQRMIRAYLDPNLEINKVYSPGIDQRNPFIPLLGNNLISLSGWPDFTLNTQTSQPGLYHEAYSYVDDIPYHYSSYDLTANFRNLTGDPITFMMLMWGWYQGLVYEGRIWPHPNNIIYNTIDYQTRIWRLIMDPSRTYVTRIGATGASFPMTAPVGNIFNFEGDGSESPFTTANDQISISFRCMGFTYYDYILVYEFNTLGEIFNKNMRDGPRQQFYHKLHPAERDYFNYTAYPRINEYTMELEWWVDKNIYAAKRDQVVRAYD